MRSDDETTQYLRNIQSRGEKEVMLAEVITDSSDQKNELAWADQVGTGALENAKPAGKLHEQEVNLHEQEGKQITKSFIRQSFE